MISVSCPWCGNDVDYAPGVIDYEKPTFQCVECGKKFKIEEITSFDLCSIKNDIRWHLDKIIDDYPQIEKIYLEIRKKKQLLKNLKKIITGF